MRIHGFDQANLFASTPSLDFFFAGDGGVGINEALIVDQAREVVAARESWDELVLVLEDAVRQISSNARVQHMRAGPIGHDVNAKLFGFSQCSFLLYTASSRNSAYFSRVRDLALDRHRRRL